MAGHGWLWSMILSMGVSLATAVFAYRRRRRVPAARAFALIPLSHAAWTALEIAEILAPTRDAKLFLDGLGWLPGLGMVAGSLWFGYEYVGRRMPRGLWGPILALPLVGIALLVTEPWHHRLHPDAWVRTDRVPASLEYTWSWVDWGLIAYGFVMVGAGCALVLRKLVRQPAYYVSQTLIVLTGLGLAPVAALVALALGLRSFGQRNPAPVVFGLADLVVAFGLFAHGLFDLTPVACEAVVAGLDDGVVVVDRAGRVVDANASLCAVLGCKSSDLIGRLASEAFAPWPALVAACAGQRRRDELEVEAPDGLGHRWLDINASALSDRRHRALGRAVVLRDVSERKRARHALEAESARLQTRVHDRTRALEETLDALRTEDHEREETETALRATERRFRAIFDHSFELVGLLDRDGRLLAANRTALQFAGVDGGAVVGRWLWETPWWSHSGTLQAELRAAIPAAAAGDLVRFEVTHVGRDKRARYFDFSLKAVHGDGGGVEFLIAEGRDVTELRRAEQENAALAEKLQHAHRLDSIGRLAGGVAHDFNNLLTAMLGSVEVARRETAPGTRAADALTVIEQAADSAAQLTRQLLTFGRRQPVAPRVIDVAAGLARMEPLLDRVVGPKVQLELRAPPDSWSIRIDEGQLEQVLVNLAVNARDAMPNGGRLTVALENVTLAEPRSFQGLEAAPAEYLELRVEDTGVGMKDHVLERIFEPFFTTKGAGQGTGLGLPVVYGIVRQNGGYIEVRSQPGVGTEFRLLFPHADGPLDLVLPGSAAGVAPPTGHERIVLVEDQHAVRAYVRDLLESLGYDVRAYADGESALAATLGQAEPPDLVVADVVLPGVSGVEIADRLRRRWPALAVLLVSGFADDALQRRDLLPGIHFLAKPFRAEALAVKVRAALDGGQATAHASAPA
jgi:PAS domain S-box-containing protein